MPDTTFAEKHYISTVDGHRDRYMIEHPVSGWSDLLVVYLHSGLAHAGQGFCENRDWCMGDLRDEVLGRQGVYVSPDLRGDAWMNSPAESDLLALLTELKAEFGSKKLILAGASLGATSALIFASHHPELITGVIALCPATDMTALFDDLHVHNEHLHKHVAATISRAYGGPPSQAPAEYAYRSSIHHTDTLTMPLAIRHGESDEIIPVAHSRNLADHLQAQNTPVRCDIIPGDHSAPVHNAPWCEYLDFALRR